jgi:hypothetical protein
MACNILVLYTCKTLRCCENLMWRIDIRRGETKNIINNNKWFKSSWIVTSGSQWYENKNHGLKSMHQRTEWRSHLTPRQIRQLNRASTAKVRGSEVSTMPTVYRVELGVNKHAECKFRPLMSEHQSRVVNGFDLSFRVAVRISNTCDFALERNVRFGGE